MTGRVPKKASIANSIPQRSKQANKENHDAWKQEHAEVQMIVSFSYRAISPSLKAANCLHFAIPFAQTSTTDQCGIVKFANNPVIGFLPAQTSCNAPTTPNLNPSGKLSPLA